MVLRLLVVVAVMIVFDLFVLLLADLLGEGLESARAESTWSSGGVNTDKCILLLDDTLAFDSRVYRLAIVSILSRIVLIDVEEVAELAHRVERFQELHDFQSGAGDGK